MGIVHQRLVSGVISASQVMGGHLDMDTVCMNKAASSVPSAVSVGFGLHLVSLHPLIPSSSR